MAHGNEPLPETTADYMQRLGIPTYQAAHANYVPQHTKRPRSVYLSDDAWAALMQLAARNHHRSVSAYLESLALLQTPNENESSSRSDDPPE